MGLKPSSAERNVHPPKLLGTASSLGGPSSSTPPHKEEKRQADLSQNGYSLSLSLSLSLYGHWGSGRSSPSPRTRTRSRGSLRGSNFPGGGLPPPQAQLHIEEKRIPQPMAINITRKTSITVTKAPARVGGG